MDTCERFRRARMFSPHKIAKSIVEFVTGSNGPLRMNVALLCALLGALSRRVGALQISIIIIIIWDWCVSMPLYSIEELCTGGPGGV